MAAAAIKTKLKYLNRGNCCDESFILSILLGNSCSETSSCLVVHARLYYIAKVDKITKVSLPKTKLLIVSTCSSTVWKKNILY